MSNRPDATNEQEESPCENKEVRTEINNKQQGTLNMNQNETNLDGGNINSERS